MDIRLLLLITFITIKTYAGYSQQISFKHIGTKDGLPSNEVYNLYEDRQGYIWAFTKYGIVKHNGIRFVPVCTNIPFSESAVYSISESPSGKIYLANSTGHFYEIIHDSAIKVNGMENLSDIIIRQAPFINIICAADHRVYVQAYLGNSYEFDTRSKTIEQMKPAADAGSNTYTFREVTDGILFPIGSLGETKSVQIEKDGHIFSYRLPYKSSFKSHCTGIRTRKGMYLLASEMLVFIDTLHQIKTVKFGLQNLDFKIDRKDHIWVATHTGGLLELDTNLRIINHYLKGYTVSGMLFDRQGGLWISTISNGIYYCRNTEEQHDARRPGVTSMIKVIGNKLFTGSSNGLLREHDSNGKTVRVFHTPIGMVKDVQDIVPFKKGYAIAGKAGVFLTDTNFRIYSKYGLYDPFRASLSYGIDNYHDSLLLSLSVRGFYTFDDKNLIRVDPFIVKSQCVLHLRDATWLYGTYTGLHEYNLQQITSPPYLQPLCEKNIRCMAKDKLDNIWIGTEGNGLYKLRPDSTFQRISSLPGSVVNHVSVTEQGNILCATNTGLFISTLGTRFRQIYEGEVMKAVSYAGRIYLSNDKGLISIAAPQKQDSGRYAFYLRSAFVNGDEISLQGQTLRHDQNTIQFNFDFLNYAFPDKKCFYQLNGPVSLSGYTKGTQLSFQQLPPGSYSLSVTLILFDNIHDSTRTFYFTIAPAIWQTQWFAVSASVAALILLLLLFMMMQNYIRKKEYRKNEITRLLAEHKLTALKAQINPHFISNSLAAIQQLMLTDHSDKAGLYIAKFSLMIRSVLKHSDQSLVTLNEELRIMDLNIELEQLRFGQAFSFKCTTDPSIDTDDIWVPPLITQPFIENAIWHGLLPLKNIRAGLLTVEIKKQDNQLVISITDNGVGRQTAVRKHTFGNMHQSKGNELSLKRIENLNKLYEAGHAASVHITDLVSDEHEPLGTRVDIVLPFIPTRYDAFKKDAVYHH